MDPGIAAQRHPSVYRREFALPAAVEWARAYVCGPGLYELEINGRKVGDEYLMPGYHSYEFFVECQTYDIGDYLQAGQNCVGAILGMGWHKGESCLWSNTYGDTMQLIAELRIRLVSGQEVVIGTGADWAGRKSPAALSGIYPGEDWVAADEVPGWLVAGGCDRTDQDPPPGRNCAAAFPIGMEN
jgi:alpha-L-rhamnosidase